jgi:membrane protease YdiL (CAAX protease family)
VAPTAALLESLELPATQLERVSWFDALLGYLPIKALLPLPILALLAPAIWWVFRDTWRLLDREALEARQVRGDTPDYRPAVCLVMVAAILTLQEYYGGRHFFELMVRPQLVKLEAQHPEWFDLRKWGDIYSYSWWVAARVLGYVLLPLPLWKLMFPKDSLLDMGLRLRGFSSHLGLYALCLLVVIPVTALVAFQPDFGNYYPFYKLASRSWFDFFLWESIYAVQFFALELFFRGFALGALRPSLGSAAIFVMAVPYCMIHFGKPYLETHGAIVAGVVLGSLAMRTRSVYAGFLVHVTVAVLMDTLALFRRGELPTAFWPT